MKDEAKDLWQTLTERWKQEKLRTLMLSWVENQMLDVAIHVQSNGSMEFTPKSLALV